MPTTFATELISGLGPVLGDGIHDYISGLIRIAPLNDKNNRIFLTDVTDNVNLSVVLATDLSGSYGVSARIDDNCANYIVDGQLLKALIYRTRFCFSSRSIPMSPFMPASRTAP